MLVKLGYEADIASNGEEAITKVLSADYDLVLMDLQMPVMDGLEATKIIRSTLPKNKQPYIMAITANAMEGDRQRCLDNGMNDYLAKPLTMTTLGLSLKTVLEKIKTQQFR